jgi:hypothetical protein
MSTEVSSRSMKSSTATSWRRIVTERPLAGALVASFVATHLATVMGYWFHGLSFGGARFPDAGWPSFNGFLLVPNESGIAQFWAGSVYHFFTGMCFSLTFCLLLFPMFKGKNTVGGNIAKGVIYGLVLATLSALWWVPQLFPGIHAGFFSHNLGLKAVLGIYLFHIIYGVNLGAFYSPLPTEEL